MACSKNGSICIFTEGETEKKLLGLLNIIGNVKVYNPVEKEIEKLARTFLKGQHYHIVLNYDVDTKNYATLRKNIINLNRRSNVTLHLLQQNNNLEDELKKACGVKAIHTLVGARSRSDFKREFMKCNNPKKLMDCLDKNLLWDGLIVSDLEEFENCQIDYKGLSTLISK